MSAWSLFLFSFLRWLARWRRQTGQTVRQETFWSGPALSRLVLVLLGTGCAISYFTYYTLSPSREPLG